MYVYAHVVNGIHHLSTGLGRTHPDPSHDVTLPDGVVVPKGKGVDSRITNSSLLYNEYPYNLGHRNCCVLVRAGVCVGTNFGGFLILQTTKHGRTS